MRKLNRNILITLSLFLNVVLLGGVTGYTYFVNRDKKEYFDFVKNIELSYTYSADTTTVVCFVGNSITANWANLDAAFFDDNRFLNRGVGGQSSTQVLLRFQHDVVAFSPSIVVLNTGINDIAQSDGFYKEWFTLQNIQSIIDICNSNGIQLVLTSVLPATEIKISRLKSMVNLYAEINRLNLKIKDLAEKNDLIYVDYFSSLADSDGNFDKRFTFDGVHPNKEGYKIMEQLIMSALENIGQVNKTNIE